MTGRINKENKTITELPTMENPSIKDQKYWTNNGTKPDFELLETANKMYAEHLAGLKTFSYSGEWKAETGDEVSFTTGYQMTTWKKEVWYDCSKAAYDNTVDESRRIVAIPLPDKQPDDILDYHGINYGGPKAHKQESEEARIKQFLIDNRIIRADQQEALIEVIAAYVKRQPVPPSTYTGERDAISLSREDAVALRNYFGENDKTPFEHRMFSVLEKAIK